MAFAAERIRASVGEQMVPSTMLSVMVELARLDAHYDASQDAEVADEVLKERRRALMRAALERTAQFPPSPELAGFVDAGALGFYLAVVHSNPRWGRCDPERGAGGVHAACPLCRCDFCSRFCGTSGF